MGRPTLHLLCGKIASGKSTLARELAAGPETLLVSEDAFMAALFPDEIHTLEDFRIRSARLETALKPHIAAILQEGLSVVLDFHANTRARRDWARTIVEAAGADAILHWIDVPDAVCKARLRARNAAGTHEYAASDAQFDQFTAHFLPPQPEENWVVDHIRVSNG
ncbi:MAG: ATP-binding protein [Alphaproteobacteria bacterium]|uniref:AAA family ATPase n=1 Tax=Maricaulis alexandrii TaxID=2570354 RepID=UPI001108366B|nr:ATP-binding protein [Maricaulis alexandrii]MCR9267759.1 ATP-binding protein [Alphaproteobacteria bacterium]